MTHGPWALDMWHIICLIFSWTVLCQTVFLASEFKLFQLKQHLIVNKNFFYKFQLIKVYDISGAFYSNTGSSQSVQYQKKIIWFGRSKLSLKDCIVFLLWVRLFIEKIKIISTKNTKRLTWFLKKFDCSIAFPKNIFNMF